MVDFMLHNSSFLLYWHIYTEREYVKAVSVGKRRLVGVAYCRTYGSHENVRREGGKRNGLKEREERREEKTGALVDPQTGD